MKKITFFVLFLIAYHVSAQTTNKEPYKIEQYLNIRSSFAPSFAPDGKRVAFLSNQTGTSQVWLVSIDGGEPNQLTNYEDNISFVEFSPTSDLILFGKAVGGNENTQLYLMNADGSNVKQLTSEPKVRYNFGVWSEDGARIFYSSNKRDPNFFDIYAMEIPSGKEELIHQQNGANYVAAISKDGKTLVISRSGVELSLDNDLYAVDLDTKKAIHLTPHSGAARYGDVEFLPSGKAIALGSDSESEFYGLKQMDLASLKTRAIEQASWDLDTITLAKSGSLLAYSQNREGFSEIYLRKIDRIEKDSNSVIQEKSASINLPSQGIASGLEFSKDAGKLAFTFSSAKYNSDVWLYDLKTKNLTQLTKSDRAGIPQETFIEPILIKYKSFDGREIPAWFYQQKGLSLNVVPINSENKTYNVHPKDFPVIISVHGGPEGQERPGFNALYQYYLSRGYAILAPNVRGSTGYGKTYTHLDDVRRREDSVKDLAYAVEWLKKQNGVDAKRIAVMGGSYGGYMTLAAITLYPDLWAAAVDTVGIANFESFLQRTSGYRRRQREVEYGRLDKDLEFLRQISPIHKVDRIKTPLMVIQGKNDPRVPYTESEQIVESLRKRGVTVEYKLFEDEGHGISKLKNRLVVYPIVANFLDKHLKGER